MWGRESRQQRWLVCERPVVPCSHTHQQPLQHLCMGLGWPLLLLLMLALVLARGAGGWRSARQGSAAAAGRHCQWAASWCQGRRFGRGRWLLALWLCCWGAAVVCCCSAACVLLIPRHAAGGCWTACCSEILAAVVTEWPAAVAAEATRTAQHM